MSNTFQTNNSNNKHYYRLHLVNEVIVPIEEYAFIEANLQQLGYDKVLVDAVLTNYLNEQASA